MLDFGLARQFTNSSQEVRPVSTLRQLPLNHCFGFFFSFLFFLNKKIKFPTSNLSSEKTIESSNSAVRGFGLVQHQRVGKKVSLQNEEIQMIYDKNACLDTHSYTFHMKSKCHSRDPDNLHMTSVRP